MDQQTSLHLRKKEMALVEVEKGFPDPRQRCRKIHDMRKNYTKLYEKRNEKGHETTKSRNTRKPEK